MHGHFFNLLRTTFDLGLYDEVAKQRARRTVGYFVLTIIAYSVALTAANFFHGRALIRRELVPMLERLPVVDVRGGVAQSRPPEPWARSFEDNGVTTSFIIDTTGARTDLGPNEQG